MSVNHPTIDVVENEAEWQLSGTGQRKRQRCPTNWQTCGMLGAPLQLLNSQGHQSNLLFRDAGLAPQAYTELLKVMRDLHDQQARCDRIKNTPYPRQYAIVSTMFAAIFCTLLPFGAVPVFAER